MSIFPQRITLMKNLLSILCLFLGLIIFACQSNQTEQNTPSPDPMAHLKDQKIVSILNASFQRHGGLDKWQQRQSMQFKKYFALYDENGTTERAVHQEHHYVYQPNESIQISWTQDSSQHQIKKASDRINKWIDGQVDESAKSSSLNNTIASATFVVDIPFKLLDKGVDLKYEGTDQLDSVTTVDVIRATYNPDQHAHHTTPDIWWYYFDQKDARLCGYMVKHLDHYSYVRNLSYIEKDGYLLTKDRKSYRVDSLRNLLYLRADYAYSDYQIR